MTIKVDNLANSTQRVIENGGALIYEEFNRNLVCDNSREAFFYLTDG
jgi:hypothetical protein